MARRGSSDLQARPRVWNFLFRDKENERGMRCFLGVTRVWGILKIKYNGREEESLPFLGEFAEACVSYFIDMTPANGRYALGEWRYIC